MKALVAGGAGFIGSHLIDALLREGDEVVCIDNFFIGTRENIAHLKNEPRFTFYEQDLTELDAVQRIFEKEKPDYVFHLAANSDIQASLFDDGRSAGVHAPHRCEEILLCIDVGCLRGSDGL